MRKSHPKREARGSQERLKKNRMLLLYSIIAVVALAIVLSAVWISAKSQIDGQSKYTNEEMQKFWDDYLDVLIGEQLSSYGHPNDTVNQIVQNLSLLIDERFADPMFEYRRVQSYGRYVNTPLIASRDNGRLIMAFIMPDIMDAFYTLQADQSAVQRELFKDAIALAFIHELQHFAFDPVFDFTEEAPFTLDDRVKHESIVWAKTAQSMELLLNTHTFQIESNLLSFYNAWVQAGRDENSSEWRNFIRGVYSDTVSH